jgi:hypothetical protein
LSGLERSIIYRKPLLYLLLYGHRITALVAEKNVDYTKFGEFVTKLATLTRDAQNIAGAIRSI